MLMVAGIGYQLPVALGRRSTSRPSTGIYPDRSWNVHRPRGHVALIEDLWKLCGRKPLVKKSPPFLRMPYNEAMNRFGSDKPDMRFGLEIQDFSDDFRGSNFKVFAGAVQSGGTVKLQMRTGRYYWGNWNIWKRPQNPLVPRDSPLLNPKGVMEIPILKFFRRLNRIRSKPNSK